jgi:hypothetical protein
MGAKVRHDEVALPRLGPGGVSDVGSSLCVLYVNLEERGGLEQGTVSLELHHGETVQGFVVVASCNPNQGVYATAVERRPLVLRGCRGGIIIYYTDITVYPVILAGLRLSCRLFGTCWAGISRCGR